MKILKSITLMMVMTMLLSVGVASAEEYISDGDVLSVSTESLNEVDGLHVVSKTINSLEFGWVSPESYDSLEVVGNVILVEQGDDVIVDNVRIESRSGDEETYLVEGLVPETEYTVTVKTVYSDSDSIVLCTKAIRTDGEPWGYCDDSETVGSFKYVTEHPTLLFEAEASNLGLDDGTEYSVVYYKDADTTHTVSSVVNVLGTAVSVDHSVTFSGDIDIGSIPSADDANSVVGRGKIWIVPSGKINEDFTLDWSGYGNDVVLVDFLYEEDLTSDPIPDNMGGITYIDTDEV